MKTRELRERMLVALFLETRVHGLHKYLDVPKIAEKYNLPEIIEGQLRAIVQALDSQNMVKSSVEIGGGVSCIMTSYGLEEAEDLLDQHPEYSEPHSAANNEEIAGVPASDRYVTLAHNQLNEIQPDLQQLRENIGSSNEATEEDREIARSEIAIFEASIIQTQVPIELIERFSGHILKWISQKFGDGLVSAIVGALIEKLSKFLLN